MRAYHVPDPVSGFLRATFDADTAAAYIAAWMALHPAEAEREGVPVVVDGRAERLRVCGLCCLDRPALRGALRRLAGPGRRGGLDFLGPGR